MKLGPDIIPICQEFYEIENLIKNHYKLMLNRKILVENVINTFINHDIRNHVNTENVILNELLVLIGKGDEQLNSEPCKKLKQQIKLIGGFLYRRFKGKEFYFHGCLHYEIHFYVAKPVIAP